MPEGISVYGQYCILHLMADEPGYKAGIAFKPEERGDTSHRYFLNVYEDHVVAVRVKKMLPWISTPDYIENFECGQALVLVFTHTNGTALDECMNTSKTIAERLELVKKSVIFIVNQLEHFPVAMLSCMIKPSSIICDKDQMRFIYFVRFRGEYPYDIQELMPHFGRFFSECLPSVCKRDKRVKQFIEKCEKKAFDGVSGLVSEFNEISAALVKKYGHKDNFNIFNKYSDILQGYAPVKKKRRPALAIIAVIILLIIVLFAYIYFFPEKSIVILNNSDILKAIKDFLTR